MKRGWRESQPLLFHMAAPRGFELLFRLSLQGEYRSRGTRNTSDLAPLLGMVPFGELFRQYVNNRQLGSGADAFDMTGFRGHCIYNGQTRRRFDARISPLGRFIDFPWVFSGHRSCSRAPPVGGRARPAGGRESSKFQSGSSNDARWPPSRRASARTRIPRDPIDRASGRWPRQWARRDRTRGAAGGL